MYNKEGDVHTNEQCILSNQMWVEEARRMLKHHKAESDWRSVKVHTFY